MASWKIFSNFDVKTSSKDPQGIESEAWEISSKQKRVSSLLNFILIWFTEDAQRLQNISYENTRLLAASQKAD